jgi:hypothetical protein
MDVESIIDAMLGVAKAALPLVQGGQEAAELGEKVVELIDHARDTFEGEDMDELIEQRDAIEQAVNSHVDSTVAKLRGED